MSTTVIHFNDVVHIAADMQTQSTVRDDKVQANAGTGSMADRGYVPEQPATQCEGRARGPTNLCSCGQTWSNGKREI
jgi:hypothetical protein